MDHSRETSHQMGAEAFIDHFGLQTGAAPGDRLRELGHAFAAFPYENLSKLVKKHTMPPGPSRRRLPAEVVADHLELGAGGTCFALTELFRAVLSRLGISSHPVLCDTRHRAANHCALVVALGNEPMLVDPGYLLHEPLHLSTDPGRIRSETDPALPSLGARLVTTGHDRRHAELYTFGTWRYRVDLEPVSRERFLKVWDASFEWTMMSSTHICVRSGNGYDYVNGIKLNHREPGHKEAINIRGREAEVLSRRAGIDPRLVDSAYTLVRKARADREPPEASAS